MIKDNNTKWGKHRGQFHKKIVDLIMIFSRSLFFVDHIQKSFLTKPTHTIPCTTSSSESEETSSQSSKNKRREKVFMATGFPSTSILCLSVSSGERLASNRSLFANKWTIVACSETPEIQGRICWQLASACSFPQSQSKRRWPQSFTPSWGCMESEWTWSSLDFRIQACHHIPSRTCLADSHFCFIVWSSPAPQPEGTVSSAKEQKHPDGEHSRFLCSYFPFPKNQGHLGGTIGHHNQLLHQNGHFAVVTHHISGIISPQKYMACMVPRK